MKIPGRGGFSLPIWATKVAPTLTESTLKFIFMLNNCFFMPAGMALNIDRHRQTGNVAREQPDMNP